MPPTKPQTPPRLTDNQMQWKPGHLPQRTTCVTLAQEYRKMRPEFQRQCSVQIGHLHQCFWDFIQRNVEGVTECDPPPNNHILKIIHRKMALVQSRENRETLNRDFQRKILVNKRLMKESLDPNAISDDLVTKGIFDDNDMKKILKPKSREDRVHCLVQALRERDFEAISDFVIVLADNDYRDLADAINSSRTDSSGRLVVPGIRIKIQLLHDETLLDVPNSFRKVFDKESHLMETVRQRYGIELFGPTEPHDPLTLDFQKTNSYNAKELQRDLLSLKVAKLMEDHLDDNTTRKIILDVDLSDVIAGGCDDESLKRLPHPFMGSSDSGTMEDECEPNCDGSCIIAIFINREEGRHHKKSLTKDWHEKLITMTTKHSFVRGKKEYTMTASEIRHAVLQQRQRVSISIIRTQSPMTVLHHAVIESRKDVIRVLFETGILHELVDCKVTQKMSRYNSKTAQEITNEPQHTAIKESFQQILKEEKELPWLHKCARAGDMDGARILMERHPDQLRMKDSKGGLPLYWAIMGGCAELVQMILSSTTADDVLDIGRMEPGGTALCLAASVCRSDLIPILVQYGADPDVTGSGNKTPLEYAIKEKDQKTIRTLFDAGASLPTDALCHSVITGHLGAFEAILNEETNVDKQDNTGMCALLYAAQRGHIRMINKLLEMGAGIRCTNLQKRNVFHMAVESGSVAVLQRVIQEARMQHCIGELINLQDKYLGKERCFIVRGRDNDAAAFHYIECHRWLISIFNVTTQTGGTVDVANFGTPIVSGWGTSPAPEYIERMDSRYDVRRIDAQNPLDLTPLNLLALSTTAAKSTKMAEILIEALVHEGLSLDTPDCFGLTPMHMAAMRGNMALTQLLWKHGANHRLNSTEGHSVAEVAERNNHLAISNYIKGHDVLNCEKIPQFLGEMEAVKDALQSTKLKELWKQGASVEKHVVDRVRSLEDTMKELLFQLGASTIQAESGSTAIQNRGIGSNLMV